MADNGANYSHVLINRPSISYIIQYQGNRPICWAIPIVEVTASVYAIQRGLEIPPDLSTQQLIDHVPSHYYGELNKDSSYYRCHVEDALRYSRDVGLRTAAAYPPRAGNYVYPPPRLPPSPPSHRYMPTAWEVIPRDDAGGPPARVQMALHERPLIGNMVCSQAIGDYCGGRGENENPIYNEPYCYPGTNPLYGVHSVVILGYGFINNEPFYYIKNSWGEGWGDGGFGLVSTNLFYEIIDIQNVIRVPA